MLTCLACGEQRAWEAPCPACRASATEIDGFTAFAPESAHAGAGFDARRFGFLSSVQDRNFWFRGRKELIAWAINRRRRFTGDASCSPIGLTVQVKTSAWATARAVSIRAR